MINSADDLRKVKKKGGGWGGQKKKMGGKTEKKKWGGESGAGIRFEIKLKRKKDAITVQVRTRDEFDYRV